MHLQMPTQVGEARSERDDIVDWCGRAEMAHEMEASAAEADGVQPAWSAREFMMSGRPFRCAGRRPCR